MGLRAALSMKVCFAGVCKLQIAKKQSAVWPVIPILWEGHTAGSRVRLVPNEHLIQATARS